MMPWSDFLLVLQWWGALFLFGAAVYPLTSYLFSDWHDRGFLFTKAVGLAVVTYVIYLLGTFHVAPFTVVTVWVVLGVVFFAGLLLQSKKKENQTWRQGLTMAAEELFFFAALLFWTWIKAHEPSIHALEKFMDFGFTKSILDSRYFPAPDMWYAGLPINYYYFGHLAMAVLTRLSGIDLTYTFNLMLATIFAFCFTMSFSIGRQLTKKISGGFLTAFLVTLAGNMQTIYAFTIGYDGANVQPFWQLLGRMNLNRYWYADATRFIPNTIHEFPSYSFVVSDVHGHVLSIPFVLLTIALLITITVQKQNWVRYIFYGFLCGVLLMTNALDGPIYLALLILVLLVAHIQSLGGLGAKVIRFDWKKIGAQISIVIGSMVVVSIPFLWYFRSFVNGIAVNCPPARLANTKIGPIIFESVDKCQHSPLWMWWLLWGFFVYCGLFVFVPIAVRLWHKKKIEQQELLLSLAFVFFVLLLIFPEFFYFKDIYPTYFRANTMFKLGYQAFIMLSIISAYAIMTTGRSKLKKIIKIIFYVVLIPQLFLVSIYPIFSVRSYFNSLQTYQGIFGMGWFMQEYPDDWAGIQWLNAQIKNAQYKNNPVIVEADGDSYTDYDRYSAFTGLPTVVGWAVHEWLWRGSYDVVSPRRNDVGEIYQSTDIQLTKQLLAKYHVRYVVVGSLERQKYGGLDEAKFTVIGKAVFHQGQTTIYQIR